MKLRTVNATRYVTPLREGGSLPAIVEADDAGMYVLKFRGAGQGPKVLVAEIIVGELARAAGLPMPEIVLIELESDLARTEPDAEIQQLIRDSAGLNLAFDYLPGSVTFDPVAEDSAQVNIRWEKISVPFTVKVPDVGALTLTKLKTTVGEAKADDWRTPMQAGMYLINNSNTADDQQGLAWLDQSIKVKETFQNLSNKANALYKLGKKEEAFALADQAIQRGKADKVDTTNFEKRLADMKAGKI